MWSLRLGRRSARVLLITVVVLATTAGVAMATRAVSSIVGPDGTIHGCYKVQNGQLRVLSAGQACGPSELAIEWSKSGPRGATGAAGATGAQGAKGDKGDAGTPGRDGTDGIDGAAGLSGAPCLPTNPACIGAKGDPGAKGETGSKGDACLSSDPACVGPRGEKGDKGDPGTDGTNGVVTWARFSAAGTLLDHNAGVTEGGLLSVFGSTVTGVYLVDFAHTVAGCAWMATLADATFTSVPAGSVAITLGTHAQQLFVYTANSAGNPANRPFSLTLIC
jgi:hypothetical protein